MSQSKSVRLSNAIREDIKQSMLNAWIARNPIPFDLDKMSNNIADAIWKKHYGKLPLNKIPKHMLKASNSVKIQIAGAVKSFRMSEERPYEIQGSYTEAILEVHDESPQNISEYFDAKQKVSEWEKVKTEFIEEITVILDSVNSTGQLIQLWPEAEQYLPPFAADPSKGINLPALKTSRLNEMLGIK